MTKKILSDEEFMAWAESQKICRYCARGFVGPVCPCELRRINETGRNHSPRGVVMRVQYTLFSKSRGPFSMDAGGTDAQIVAWFKKNYGSDLKSVTRDGKILWEVSK